MQKRFAIFYVIISLFILFFTSSAFAILTPEIPGSIEPGVIGKYLTNQQPQFQPAKPQTATVKPPEEKKSALGAEAAKIKMTLNKIVLEGNHVYSDKEIEALYKDKLGKTITVADLENIVQSITNYYRNNGYILTRAILPPQHISNGVVNVRIIEGYINDVRVQGNPKRAKYLLQKYMDNVKDSRPLQVDDLQYYLRISNEIPGMNAKAVLEPAKQNVGASDVNVVAEQKTGSAYFSYDNYGTLFLGPNQLTGNVTANSIFQSGDTTRLTLLNTTKPQDLRYGDIAHEIPMGDQGFRATIGVNNSITHPGFTLTPLKLEGDAVNFYALFQHPIIRESDQNFTVNGAFNYVDSGTDTFEQTLYNDHIRSAQIGFAYDVRDSWLGSNTMGAVIEHGFPWAGASTNPWSLSVSRFGADGLFTKVSGSVGRLQRFTSTSRYSAYIYTVGQYSFNPLLATEQFAFGGSQLGRGYDPAEIIGDRGAAGTLELRADASPEWYILNSFQAYAFYDVGVIWNKRKIVGVKQKQSATSTGFGVRFNFMKNLSGNFMFSQPLTKEIFAQSLKGEGRDLRGQFSLVAFV